MHTQLPQLPQLPYVWYPRGGGSPVRKFCGLGTDIDASPGGEVHHLTRMRTGLHARRSDKRIVSQFEVSWRATGNLPNAPAQGRASIWHFPNACGRTGGLSSSNSGRRIEKGAGGHWGNSPVLQDARGCVGRRQRLKRACIASFGMSEPGQHAHARSPGGQIDHLTMARLQ